MFIDNVNPNSQIWIKIKDVAHGSGMSLVKRLLGISDPVQPQPPVVVSTTVAAEEFLPSGDPLVSANPTPATQSTTTRPKVEVPARLRFIEALGPVEVIAGTRKLDGSPYIAFRFQRVVVLECALEGNACYLFEHREDWLTLAQQPKTELIRQKPAGFIGRVVHQGDWQSRVKAAI